MRIFCVDPDLYTFARFRSEKKEMSIFDLFYLCVLCVDDAADLMCLLLYATARDRER